MLTSRLQIAAFVAFVDCTVWQPYLQWCRPVGVILANLAFLLMSATNAPDVFMQWGWRVPFLVSVVLIGLALFVQLRLEDTVEFLKLQQSGGVKRKTAASPAPRSPVLEAPRTHPKQIALAAGAFLAVQVPFYILIAFVIAYGTGASGPAVSRNTMLAAVLVGAVAMILRCCSPQPGRIATAGAAST